MVWEFVIPSRVTLALVDTLIPWMLMRLVLSRLAKEKGHQVRVMGVYQCGGAHFQRDCNARKNTSKQSSGKGKQSKSWSKSEGKGKSKGNKEKSKGQSKATKGAKGSHKGKIENSKSEASSETQESANVCTTDLSWNDGWSLDEWNDGWNFDERNDDWSSVGWHEVWEQAYDTSASSFSVGGIDLGATSSLKRFEWVKMNLERGAAVNTFPWNFGPTGAGDGRFYQTTSSEWVPGGAWQFQGYDENRLLRSLNGRLTGVHIVLCSRVHRTTRFLPRT